MLLHPEGVERVQPGVSTPGTPSPRRGALKGRQIKRRHNTGQTCTHLSPFQGEPFVWMVPRVETSVCLASCPNPSRPRRRHSSFVLDHTVPYGTALLGGVFPGTSCQATIAPSLRDNSQQALARCCCEMSASASRRDDADRSQARSAWNYEENGLVPAGRLNLRLEASNKNLVNKC